MAKFRVRARTVDMLGRQQIAGIPTAISELFKNAHDAYARNSEVDYFRKDRLFIIRDDGMGMTKEDFEQRWLTIGTESKLGAVAGLARPPRDDGQPKRPILGEKGIGRLAIATLGPQVLILTRAKKKAEKCNLVASFIHWGLFELPGVDLDQIQIPVIDINPSTMLTRKQLSEMISQVERQLSGAGFKENVDQVKKIKIDLQKFTSIDPEKIYENLGAPFLTGKGHGTHFLISPSDNTLPNLIDRDEDDLKLPQMQKMLLGFSNTMTPNHKEPPIQVAFRDYKEGNLISDDIISDKLFFTPEEFKSADHYFKGTFDECGNFKGKVSIYGHVINDYELAWRKGAKEKTDCGSFTLNFASVQGMLQDSSLPPEEWSRMNEKLNRMGGLYVYRNGIRILPYGDSDYDYLDIELRRSKGAAYYFYSYRRLFGVIELDSNSNAGLQEKAGREGFRENKAYNQFRDILKNFFVQTAVEFFRERTAKTDLFVKERERLNKLHQIRQQREEEAKKARDKLAKDLRQFFQIAGGSKLSTAINTIEAQVQKQLTSFETRLSNGKSSTLEIIKDLELSEAEAIQKIDELKRELKLEKPEGIGLTEELKDAWSSYEETSQQLLKRIIDPAYDRVNRSFTSFVKKHEKFFKMGEYFIAHMKKFSETRKRSLDEKSKEIINGLNKFSSHVINETRRCREIVERSFNEELDTFSNTPFHKLDNHAIADARTKIQNKIDDVFENEKKSLERLFSQVNYIIHASSKKTGFSHAELTEALEEELAALKIQRDNDLELIQVGMAINIINHEFEKTIGSMRRGVEELSMWAKQNAPLDPVYKKIRTNFEHLDSYLRLFTPFDKRLQRSAVTITGKEIYLYLQDLFRDRLDKNEIELKPSEAFLKQGIKSYRSSIYPCFVNLIDNSIYWLSKTKAKKPLIKLDRFKDGFLVVDNGPGVDKSDIERVFELGFSRKPNGRGMGLYISRETLKKAGYELTLMDTPASGASFAITSQK